MFFFIKIFLFNIFLIELTPLIDTSEYQSYSLLNIYLYIFVICFFLNFYLDQSIKYNINFDLIFKYFLLFTKNFSFLFNYFFNTVKKIFLFLYHFKYRHLRKSIYIFSRRYLSRFFLIWRPLFKKTSYFGYFRSNRSKWIK